VWTDRDPDRAITHAFDVDPEHGTFAFEDDKLQARGTGTLVGKAWEWTGYRATITAKTLALTSEAELGKGQLVIRNTGTRGGKSVMSSRLDAIVIDCKELDARRAALVHASASAVHRCYEGTDTIVGGPAAGKQATLYEQIVDTKTNAVELRHWTESSDSGRSIVFAVKGDTIVVSVGGLRGKGTIAHAWTDYTWTTSVQSLEVTARGTLGGPKMTMAVVMRHAGKEVSRTDTSATAFDCAKLPEHRAAVAARKPPIP